MRVELRITSGSRAGQRDLLEKSVISIGRNPLSDVRFHPEQDPDVSGKHAEIRILGEVATLHDLGSTNGTFVNGERLAAPRALTSGDRLGFGAEGPVVEFVIVPAGRTDGAQPVASAAPAAPSASAATGSSTPANSAAPRRDTTARIAEAVEQSTGRLRNMVIGLGALVVVGVAGAYWVGSRDASKARAEMDALLKRNDSLSSAMTATQTAMKGRVAALDTALAAQQAEREQLRAQLEQARRSGSRADVSALSAQLDASAGRQRTLTAASQVDWPSIAAQNGKAVVFIAVKNADGGAFTGSGFNVAANGLVVTNRHVVLDEAGKPVVAVRVIFDGTVGQWKKAHVVKVSTTDELAWIKIDEGGPYPTVAGVARNSDLQVGAPLAIIGYPLGTNTAGMGADINKLQPRSSLGIGTASKVLSDTLQLDAFAAQGSSGSAIFDARGFVVGVLFGSPTESNGRIVYAVPSAKLAAQMPGEAAGIVR
jgi:S1-C subfamily serine protease/pSer/pThr/pTyr-binding forkhead associated (FHA) protein